MLSAQQDPNETDAVEKKTTLPVQPDRRRERGSSQRSLEGLHQRQHCCICNLLPGREGREEPWRLIGSHAPLKDYSCEASAFDGHTDGPKLSAAQTVADRRGLKDVSAHEAPEHICGRGALSQWH